MKRITLSLLALMLLGTVCMAQEQTKPFRCQGSVALHYVHPLNFGLKTTHGVKYNKSNIFIGGEAWLKEGFLDGTMIKAGASMRWSFVATRWVDTYIGVNAGLWYNTAHFEDSTDGADINSQGLGTYVTPELGIGIGVGNGHYIDISIDFALCFSHFNDMKRTYHGKEERSHGACCYFWHYLYPGISIGYRF